MPQKKSTNKTLVLLDAHAIIHRAYHALPDFTSAKTGEPTGALYGIAAMLMKLIPDFKPDYMAACYDLDKPTYRHEVFEGYKAGRKENDAELEQQLKRSRDLFTAFNIPIYEAEGFEADDILGTVSEQLKKEKNIDIIIASGDMDTMQLVDDKKVQVFTLKRGITDTVLYDEEKVKERFGFGPKLIPDFKGLRGDPSDNIPGVSGIGEKTASTLIQNFGSIEDIYKALKKDEKKFAAVGIKPRIVTLLKEHKEDAEFSKMLATIRRDAPIVFSIPKTGWQEGLSLDTVLNLFSDLGFRTLSARVRDLFGMKKGVEGGTSALGFSGEPKEEVFDPKLLREAQVAIWVLDSHMTRVEPDDIKRYTKTESLADAHKKLLEEIKKQKLERVFEEIEKPLIPIVDEMNARGIAIDVSFLKKLSKEYHKKLDKLQKDIYKAAGKEFNINSPRQLAEVLFDDLGLRVRGQKKTSTGARSTRESELEKMRGLHPVVDHLFEYREFQKLLSTYIDNIPGMLDKGRLHATFTQTGTTTGRMSSHDPNLQNIPIKTELGRAIRHAFVASDGYKLLSFDYSQIELRIAAILSGDKRLIETFKNGEDVHTAVAAYVFEVSKDDVTAEMRRRAKVINFGILYGMGVNALRQNLGTSREEAQMFYDAYFEKFSGLSAYLEEIKQQVRKTGYTETLFGRRGYFSGINSSLPYIRAQAERMAINAPIQGTAADLIKLAMIEVDREFQEKKEAHLLLQVHDELVYEAKGTKEEIKKVAAKIQDIMQSVLSEKQSKGVPIVANGKVGDNWGEMESINKLWT